MVAAKDSPNTKAKGGRTLAVKEIKRPWYIKKTQNRLQRVSRKSQATVARDQ